MRTTRLTALLVLVLAVVTPVAAEASHPGAQQGPPSSYQDPCEHTPAGLTPSPADLRQVVLEGLFRHDGRTTTDAHAIDAIVRLCRPLDSAISPPLRIDLHERIDTPGGADTDYAEDPSRTVVFLPPPTAGSGWRWQVRDLDAGGIVVADGAVTTSGPESAVTALRAALPPEVVRAAGDPDQDTASGLPPIAVRACSTDGDCGPGYEFVGGRNRATSGTARQDVDYVPEPYHLPLTYPSICQGAGTSRHTDRGARPRPAPAQVTVDAATARTLAARGWSLLRDLPDGRAVVRGNADAVRAVVPHAEVSPVVLHRAAVTPSDPWFVNTGPGGPTGQWSLQRVDAPRAWDHTTGAPDVLVAVLDSGFDGLHPDLAGRAVGGLDYAPTRGLVPRPLDVTTDTDHGGHGSFVSSLVAAATDDAAGMAGLGWDTGLLVARVFDAESCASDAALAAALAWAADEGAAAVNLSLGGPQGSDLLRRAGEDAVAAGVVPVAAAGNAGCPTDSAGRPLELAEYPASYDAFLSVAATGYIAPSSSGHDPIATYSTCNGEVDIAAPGGTAGMDASQQVLGACWRDPFETRGYCRQAGTSFATPLVAATVALIRTLDPGRTVTGVRQLLDDTALDLTTCPRSASPSDPHDFCTAGDDISSGSGRVRTGLAIAQLADRTETLDVLAPAADPVAGAIAASRAAFADHRATTAVVARSDVFADTLAGAPLAGGRGPILLTGSDRLDDRAAAELSRALPPGATVHLLGGTAALSQQVERDVRALGYVPDRVGGATRIATAIEVARRVAPEGATQVLVASAANWPDAVAGGAYAAERGIPLLLTWPTDAPGTVQDELGRLAPAEVVVLGGPAAVDGPTAATLDTAGSWRLRRVEGPHRWATAAAVTTQLWGRTVGRSGDRFVLVNGQLEDGWAYGLAASPLAAQRDAPLLLITDDHRLEQPRELLRDRLRYRLTKPALGVLVGPPASTPSLRDSAVQRLRELLGG